MLNRVVVVLNGSQVILLATVEGLLSFLGIASGVAKLSLRCTA
jgi:hypothetical protein